MERAAERLRRLKAYWWQDEKAVRDVAEILDDFGCFESMGDVVSFFMQPWKWEPEIEHITHDVGREGAIRRVFQLLRR